MRYEIARFGVCVCVCYQTMKRSLVRRVKICISKEFLHDPDAAGMEIKLPPTVLKLVMKSPIAN